MHTPRIISFAALPKIFSGSKALETLPRELELLGARRPLVLAYELFGRARILLLKKAFSHTHLSVASVCLIKEEVSLPDIQTILTALSENECDSIIAVGSGILQSAAKLANSLHSCRLSIEQLHLLPCSHSPLLPCAAVLTEDVDGRELSDSLLFDEFILRHESVVPKMAILDPRLLGLIPESKTAASAQITLAQLCESMRTYEQSPQVNAWLVPALRFLGDWADVLKRPQAHAALLQAGVFAQIIHSNSSYGPLWTVSEMFHVSGFCSQAEVVSALLPHYISLLYNKNKASIDAIIKDVRILSSGAPSTSLWMHQHNTDASAGLLQLTKRLTEWAQHPGRRTIIESLLRQTERLFKRSEFSEIQELITTAAQNSYARHAQGGSL